MTHRVNSVPHSNLLDYTHKLLSLFLSGEARMNAQATGLQEEKLILIFQKLIEFYLLTMKDKVASSAEGQVGDQIVQLSTLLSYYGEDCLTSQNPLNESSTTASSIGSDLLSTLGLKNILAKKSPFSVNFRFYAKCMSICLMKQIVLNRNEPSVSNGVLFPDLSTITTTATTTKSSWTYRVRMSNQDKFYNDNDLLESESESSSPVNHHISSSLPNPSFMPTSQLNSFNQKFKQAAYQFHLIFQNKLYSCNAVLIELANLVNRNLQNSIDAQSEFCLPQVYATSRHLCSHLFKEKYYLL
jgi:hypothetical protein